MLTAAVELAFMLRQTVVMLVMVPVVTCGVLLRPTTRVMDRMVIIIGIVTSARNYGNYGIFLTMGNAGFMSSTVFLEVP